LPPQLIAGWTHEAILSRAWVTPAIGCSAFETVAQTGESAVSQVSDLQRNRMKKKPENLLIVADSDHDANMLYAVGMFVPDPFIYLRLRSRSYIVMSDLEIDRAHRHAPHCRVLSL